MKFIYSAIGNNSPENREHLEKVGYKKECGTKRDPFIYTCDDGQYMLYPEQYLFEPDKLIDCRNNDPLFQAVSALRDDSDYMQWFKLRGDNKNRCFLNDKKERTLDTDWWYKLDLSELQERFK